MEGNRFCEKSQSRSAGQKRKPQSWKRFLRLAVCALIYLIMLAGAVTAALAAVWLLKNTAFGLAIISVICLLAGVLLFFRMSREEGKAAGRRVGAGL